MVAKSQDASTTTGWRQTPAHGWRGCKTVQTFLTKWNTFLPYDPTIKLPGIYPQELKIYVHTKTWTQMLRAALFIIAKTWKESRYPLARWMDRLCWSHRVMEYYSGLKTNKPSKPGRTVNAYHEVKQANLKKLCVFPTAQHSGRQIYGDSKTISSSQGEGEFPRAVKILIWIFICQDTFDHAQHQKWTRMQTVDVGREWS